MQVQEIMTRDVSIVSPDDTLKTAATRMSQLDVGALPVSDGDRLTGMITDRDIAIRGIAEGMGPSAVVREVMTPDVKYCFADQEVEEVAENMAELQLRRLPVLDRDKRLVGILSLCDIATSDEMEQAAEALCGISRPATLFPQFPPL